MALEPVSAGATPSETEVAMVKLPLKLSAGLKETPASRALTLAIGPLALQTPPAKVDVTAPEMAVVSTPAAGFDKVSRTATFALSLSLIAMSVRLRGISS